MSAFCRQILRNRSPLPLLPAFLPLLLMLTFATPLLLLLKCVSGFHVMPQGPKFVREPPPRVDFVNSRGAVIPCSATSSPSAPVVTWEKKDGSKLANVTGLRYVRPYDNSLVFMPFTPESFRPDVHSTVYRCVASTSHGKIGSREVHVQGEVIQSYQANVYDEYVVRGNTAIFKCHVPNFMRDYLVVNSWSQDEGLVIQSEDKVNKPGHRIFDINGNLYITGAHREDGFRTYRCQIKNRITGELQMSATSGKLIITDPSTNIQPQITTLPRAIKAIVGQHVYLPCVAQGHPLPSYKWYKTLRDNSLQLTMDGHKVYTIMNTGILIMTNVTPDDNGKYVCVANNSAGEDRAAFELMVREPVTVSLHTNSRTIEVGRPLVLTCVISGFPLQTSLWTKNMVPINLSSNRVKLTSPTVLSISRVEREDQGCYQCQVTSDGNDSSQGSVCLYLSEDEPKLRETFTRHTLRVGDRLSLKCVATGNPLPTLMWSVDGYSVPETHRIQYGDYVSMNGDVVSYVNISNVGQEDGGLYQCEARNEAGFQSHREEIFIMGPPFIKPLGNITVLSGNTLAIRCPVTGYPISKLIWTKGGRQLPSTERHKVYENGTLVIMDTNRQLDEGVYVCKAVNPKGEEFSRNFHIQVLRKPVISQFRFPPGLTEGMRVIVTCSVLMGDPPILVDWVKDGAPLDVSTLDIHRTEVGDLGSSLVFHAVGQKHRGNYTCVARNKVGEDRFTASMIVKDDKNEYKSISSNYHIQTLENGSLTIKEVIESDAGSYLCEAGNGVGADLSSVVRLSVHIRAHFKINFQVIKVSRGDPLRITCRAFGEKPVNIKWVKDRSEIDLVGERKYTITKKETDEGLLSELLTPSATRSDSGSYLCLTWNAFGQSEFNARVLVEEVPDPPVDPKIAEFGSKTVTIKWSPSYSGNSPINKYVIHWKRDKDSWASSSYSTEIGAASQQIFITDLKPLTSYNFRIYAVNPLGKSEPSQVVSIKTEEEVPGTAPLSVRVEPLSSKSVRIKWKPPKHIETFGSVTGYYIGYKVIGSEKPYTFKTVESHSHTKLEALINNLKKSTTYAFTVQAFNSKGAGPTSSEVTCKTLDKDPPQPPKLRIVSVTATSVSLSWSLIDETNPISGYRIYLRINSEEWKTHDTLNDGKLTAHTIRGLKCGTKYQVYLSAFNEVGNSDASESMAFNTEGGAPVAPDKASLMVINSTYIMLHLSSWRSSSCPINNFMIQYKRQGYNEWTLLSNTVSPLLENYLLPDLFPGTWYNLLLAAHSDAGSTEAEYMFATLTETGATVAPLSISSVGEDNRVRKYVQMLLPIISVFIAVVIILLLLLLLSLKKTRNIPSVPHLHDQIGGKTDNSSMSESSTGKQLYDSVQREDRNLVYCPSPYATTRVSLYFQDNQSRDTTAMTAENSYDMPLLKQTHLDSRTLCEFQQQMLGESTNLIDINQERAFPR